VTNYFVCTSTTEFNTTLSWHYYYSEEKETGFIYVIYVMYFTHIHVEVCSVIVRGIFLSNFVFKANRITVELG
jgi:hypothetical protein